jgi:hypothetical protein
LPTTGNPKKFDALSEEKGHTSNCHIAVATMSAAKYIAAGCTPDLVRSKARDPVFVDLFCGTGSMATQAARMGFSTVLSLDKDPDSTAQFCCDVLDLDDEHPFCEKLDSFIADGRVIIMHASPPCEAFSQMNTLPIAEIDIKASLELVETAAEMMKRYSRVWSLENPETGRLWGHPYPEENFAHYRTVDYCAYGGTMKKSTRFVFSSAELRDMVQPRTCPTDKSKCPACFYDPGTNRWHHTNMVNLPYDERISIPAQLCVSVLAAMRSVAVDVATQIADEMESMATPESLKRSRPQYDNEDEERDSDAEDDSDEEEEWAEVECILGKRGTGRGTFYLVKLKEDPDAEPKWYPCNEVAPSARKDYRAMRRKERYASRSTRSTSTPSTQAISEHFDFYLVKVPANEEPGAGWVKIM